jgi:DNA-binding winged helix-turn-helix (wHTH) protein
MDAPPSLYFLPFRLELGNDQLWKEDKTVPLRRKTSAVLRYLVDHPGQLVTKEQVLAAVWTGTYVEEGALTICIAELRKALGDDAKTPRFIETVHGRGYRFIGQVVSSQHSVVRRKNAEARSQESEARSPSFLSQYSLVVGRETDLAQLHNWLEKALNGERQIVFVTGEAGIGKTTVVEAFLSGIKEQGSGNNSPAPTDSRSPTPDPWIS